MTRIYLHVGQTLPDDLVSMLANSSTADILWWRGRVVAITSQVFRPNVDMAYTITVRVSEFALKLRYFLQCGYCYVGNYMYVYREKSAPDWSDKLR